LKSANPEIEFEPPADQLLKLTWVKFNPTKPDFFHALVRSEVVSRLTDSKAAVWEKEVALVIRNDNSKRDFNVLIMLWIINLKISLSTFE
jgi:hypothetical protein